MSDILLINPHPPLKGRTGNPHKRKGNMAKRRMPTALRRYWATHKRKGNPHRGHRRRSHNPHRTHHRRRHNPGFGGGGIVRNLTNSAQAGMIGAAGALGLDLLWGYGSPFLPDMLKAGYVQYLSKALGAVLIGMIGGNLMRGKGHQLTVGAMTVIIHDVAKLSLSGMGMPLGSYVGQSPIVAYGAPAIGVPHLGVPFRTRAIPAAHRMGAYTRPYVGAGHMGGFVDGGPEGTEWS